MPNDYEKLDRPTGPSLDTTHVTIPEKAALAGLDIKVIPASSPRPSNVSSPQSARSADPYETDIEAMMPTTTTDSCMKSNLRPSKSDSQVWPSKEQWKQKARAAKKKRGCTLLAGMTTRNRLIAKIIIGFLIIGIAVGIGFGVSKPLGASIWGDNK